MIRISLTRKCKSGAFSCLHHPFVLCHKLQSSHPPQTLSKKRKKKSRRQIYKPVLYDAQQKRKKLHHISTG
jgi:hypothetical protein